ncbi:MAG: cobalt ABC transporter substrate-binding protein CbiN [Candidatus Melainabacteria bacterium RIFOXYA12_FULL_32_12]|nr:MAG: cobalt ABC transporter substrate-binding protein CbiN [Candidatus Melainabacteria bacterium RIFOXYA12_FULL_32_12]
MKKNILLLGIVIILAVIPLFIAKEAEFAGADGQAEEAISILNPNYKPWFNPVFEPPSGEIESLLFALQACLGTAVIAYFIGLSKGRKENL